MRKINVNDFNNICEECLVKLVSKAPDKRSYSSIGEISYAIYGLARTLLGRNIELSEDKLVEILNKCGYVDYVRTRHYKDEKSSFWDHDYQLTMYSASLKDIQALSKLRTVFSHKIHRREDRQAELEKLLKEYYLIAYNYCEENDIDTQEITINKLTEKWAYELRKEIRMKL